MNNKITFNDDKDFHKERIAFMIVNDIPIYLKNSPLSHTQRAEELGISKEKFTTLTRGYYFNGNLVFYHRDWSFDEKTIADAKTYSKQIMEDNNISQAKVYCGVIKQKVGFLRPTDKFLFEMKK